MRDEALGVCLDVVVAIVVLLLHQRGAHGIERVHLNAVIVKEGLLHDGVEFFDLDVELVQLVVVGIQFGLGLRGHDFNGLRVVHVAHEGNVLVVGKERHRATHPLHFQCIKDLRIVGRCGQGGHVVSDDGRVDGYWRVVDEFLEVDGLFVAIGQAHVDLEVVGFLVACGQAECKSH